MPLQRMVCAFTHKIPPGPPLLHVPHSHGPLYRPQLQAVQQQSTAAQRGQLPRHLSTLHCQAMLTTPHSTPSGMCGATDRYLMLIQRWGWGLRGKGFMVGGAQSHPLLSSCTSRQCMSCRVLPFLGWLHPAVQAQCKVNPIGRLHAVSCSAFLSVLNVVWHVECCVGSPFLGP
jgi:hypothetical protein